MRTLATRDGQRYVTFDSAPDNVRAITTTRDVAPDPDHPSLPAPAVLADLGIEAGHVAWCAQVHGSRILASTTGGRQGEADALVTDRPGVVLSIRTADCVPVFLSDPVRNVVALAHAGWRGAAADLVEQTVNALTRLYNSRPGDMWAGIGPAIGKTAYEVGGDVADAFDGVHLTERGDRWLLDLPGAIASSLQEAGVGTVEPSGLCTVEQNDLFYSYRHEGTTGRLYSLLWIAS